MSIDLSIRPITPSDYDQWLPLRHGYNAFYGRSGPTALPSEITQTTWARFFDIAEPPPLAIHQALRPLPSTKSTPSTSKTSLRHA